MDCKYLMHPSDIRALPESDAMRLGLMHDFTYDEALADARSKFKRTHLLICTLEFKPDTQNDMNIGSYDENMQVISESPVVIDANDQCYPISNDEWNEFLSGEEPRLRAPMEIWVVDRTKYTAPI